MGSWNATCGVTQLPIKEGDRVVLVPLVVKNHDFLSRSPLSGSGSVDNDLIAQPFTLPLLGAYNGYGGISFDDDQPGAAYFMQALQEWARQGMLMRICSGEPVAVKPDGYISTKPADELLDILVQGEFLVNVPNQRKAWLQHLHETYASLPSENKAGFSHYQAQMKVDPKTLPDFESVALGVMFVPESLYLSLASVVGEEPSYGQWDEEKVEMVEFKGTRAQELSSLSNLSDQAMFDFQDLLAFTQEQAAQGKQGVTEEALRLFVQVQLNAVIKKNRNHFFVTGLLNPESFGDCDPASQALVDAVFLEKDAIRQHWVRYTLFATAMGSMRKHWAPQCGAGSSSELYDSATLYAAAHRFVTEQLVGCEEIDG